MKRILYCGLLYNYGKPEEGYSYENYNIEAGLGSCGYGMYVYYADCKNDYDIGDQLALEYLHNGAIDAIFHVAFDGNLDLSEHIALEAIRIGIPVIQWDCDASWRFHNWILPRKHRVTHFITTHSATIPWYKDAGLKVIKSQWGGSPLYKKLDLEKAYDVSFVGQKHGIRPEILAGLYRAGIKVALFGNYWDGYPDWHGYMTSYDDVIRVMNQSKICLNLSNPWHVGTMPQIKGRHFEIPQCGAFQLTTPADDLESYFVPEKEISIARSMDDLIEKIKFYLGHEKEREEIATAGYNRMLAEHQWSHRFEKIFAELV